MPEPALTVLSPHSDDAALSLGCHIAHWTGQGRSVRVANCFTVTDYAPHSSVQGVEATTVLRAEEDRVFFRCCGGALEGVDYRLLDYPLRLGRTFETACDTGPFEMADYRAVRTLRNEIVADESQGPFLAPLGLGGHRDHAIALRAAMESVSASRLAFYEELPYGMEATESELATRVAALEEALEAPVLPVAVRFTQAPADKLRLISGYKSQFSKQELLEMASGRECIWATEEWRDTHVGWVCGSRA